MPMRERGVSHVTLLTAAMDATVRFYAGFSACA
jgi:catechol 2,3-dioxygenase-like lactoylglutathione lyase family enzyme